MSNAKASGSVYETIKTILYETVYPIKEGEIGLTTNLYNQGLDSINSVNFALAIEEHYGITFLDEHVLGENFSSIASIIELLSTEYGIEDKSA